MGTRCLTVVKDDGKDVCVLYRQFDGYPEGHGLELCEFLNKIKRITNGISGDPKGTANGMGCLAAQLVAHFKNEVGQFYLYPSGTRDVGEEFIYVVKNKDGAPYVIVYDTYGDETEMSVFDGVKVKPVMEGTPQELIEDIRRNKNEFV